MNSSIGTTSKRALAILPTLVLISVTSCSTTTNRDLAESAVVKFHAQYNEEVYDAIQLSAADEYKGAAAFENAYLKKVHDTLGKVTKSNQVTGSVQNYGDHAVITLVYLTDFSPNRATETFVWRVKDKRASLMSYEAGFPGLSKN